MEYQLPSYQQATCVQDWLDLVAPYIDVRDYRHLCLVNKRSFTIFAPLLFRNPLVMGGQLTVAGDPDRGKFPTPLSPYTFMHSSTITQVGLLANNSDQSISGIESL